MHIPFWIVLLTCVFFLLGKGRKKWLWMRTKTLDRTTWLSEWSLSSCERFRDVVRSHWEGQIVYKCLCVCRTGWGSIKRCGSVNMITACPSGHMSMYKRAICGAFFGDTGREGRLNNWGNTWWCTWWTYECIHRWQVTSYERTKENEWEVCIKMSSRKIR